MSSVVRVFECLAGVIFPRPIFPSEPKFQRGFGKLESIQKLREELTEKEKAGCNYSDQNRCSYFLSLYMNMQCSKEARNKFQVQLRHTSRM